MRKNAAAAFVLLALAQLCFSAWNQTLILNITDANGAPAPNVDIRIIYQRSDQGSGSDGVIVTQSGMDGSYAVRLTNTVQPPQHIRTIQVEASTYYWDGARQSIEADVNGTRQLNFTVPYALERITFAVKDLDGSPVPGARVSIYGTSIARGTAQDGTAKIVLPEGLQFTGFATYGSVSRIFSSEQEEGEGENRSIEVRLPLRLQENPAGSPPMPNLFNARLVDAKGLVAGQLVELSIGGRNYSAYSDQMGVAAIVIGNATGEANARVKRNEYEYRFSYRVVNGTRNETLALYPLLRIGPLGWEKPSINCYILSANVSDPRVGLQLQVVAIKSRKFGNLTLNETLPLEMDDEGLFSAKMCIDSDVQVKARATNKYDAAESAALDLTYQKYIPPPVRPLNYSGLPPPAPPSPKPPENLFLWVVVLVLVGTIGGAAFIARKRFGHQPVRLMLGYLRLILKIMRGRRRGPPPISPFG